MSGLTRSLADALPHFMRQASRALLYRAPHESEGCLACGSRSLYELDLLKLQRPVDARRHGFVAGCNECGLVFANPPPSRQEQDHFYSPNGAWGAPRVASPAHEPHRSSGPAKSWSQIFDPIRSELSVMEPLPGARVLDFGCGAGKLLNHLQDRGWDTYGIEPALDLAFERHRRLQAVPGEPTFDVIIANHVLEHVTNPLELLRQFTGASRPGGFLLVGVPRLDTLPYHRDYRYVINGRAHVTAYTWACLHELMSRAGWSPVAAPVNALSQGGRGQTSARMRVLARRTEAAPVVFSVPPADEARRVMRQYFAEAQDRPVLLRFGLFQARCTGPSGNANVEKVDRLDSCETAPSFPVASGTREADWRAGRC